MKAIHKGEAGYLDYKKKVEIIRTVLYFSLVAAIFFLGYSQSGTRNNLLTVVAVLGCLPSAKSLVGVIMRLPYAAVKESMAVEIHSEADQLTIGYDLLITSREKVMPIECILISGSQIVGYASSTKVNKDYVEDHIEAMLSQYGVGNVTVKILHDYTSFLSRAKTLNARADHKKEEEEALIKGGILNISL